MNNNSDIYSMYGNMELYTDAHPETTIKVGFKDKKAALKSIKDISLANKIIC